MTISVRLLRANHGDCILVSHNGPQGAFNVLIDGGTSSTFSHGPWSRYHGHLRTVLDEIKAKKECIDLAILTHIDDDHIGGLLRGFESPDYLRNMVKKVWFNSSRTITQYFSHPIIEENNIYLNDESAETGVKQGKAFEVVLEEIQCKRASLIMSGQIRTEGPFSFKILSPDEASLRKLLCVWPHEEQLSDTAGGETDHSFGFDELLENDEFSGDSSVPNGSSIAFIMEADGKAMLFLGDAHDKTIVKAIGNLGYSGELKLNLDLVKVSHHGSKNNTSATFLKMLQAERFLLSTNGLRHGHPDKRTIARILASDPDSVVLFNYGEVIDSLLLSHEKGKYLSRMQLLDKEITL